MGRACFLPAPAAVAKVKFFKITHHLISDFLAKARPNISVTFHKKLTDLSVFTSAEGGAQSTSTITFEHQRRNQKRSKGFEHQRLNQKRSKGFRRFYFEATTSISKSSVVSLSFLEYAPSLAPNKSIFRNPSVFKSHVISLGT